MGVSGISIEPVMLRKEREQKIAPAQMETPKDVASQEERLNTLRERYKQIKQKEKNDAAI